MNAQYTIQQGTVGVSIPEGKLLGVPFLTLDAPKSRQLEILAHTQIEDIA